MKEINVRPAKGKLGIMCVGLGAVSSTFITGVLMIRKGLGKPIGSMTQMDKIRVGKDYKKYGEIVPLTDLDDIVYGAWDIFPDNAFESAMHAEVLRDRDIYPVKEELEAIHPYKAVFDPDYVKRLNGTWIKEGKNRWDLMEQVRKDIRDFKEANHCERIVVIWAASTEIYAI
jgi:myo-inositol-1-phosphate synthase